MAACPASDVFRLILASFCFCPKLNPIMSSIKNIGSFYPVSDEGYIENPCGDALIQPRWAELVEAAKAAYVQLYGRQLHSVYLRGSVAVGRAVEFVSDLDTFAVLNSDVKQDKEKEHQLETQLGKKYPFASGVEIYTRQLSDFDDPKNAWCFILQTQTLCLHGEDLAQQIPPFKPGKEIAFFARYFSRQLQQFWDEAHLDDALEFKLDCSWIMKRFVRAGFDLVMERSGKFTRDLYPCYTTFAEYYPGQKAQMHQALAWAVDPAGQTTAVMDFSKSFGGWLVSEIEQVLG